MGGALEDVVDGIYEAGVVPETWPKVLSRLARETGSIGTMLFVTNLHQISQWTACDGAAPIMEAWIREGWPARTRRPARMFAERRAGWVTEADVFTPEELRVEPDYQGFYVPRGLGHAAGTGIFLPTGDSAVFDLERTYASGPLSGRDRALLDGLRPHLGRAALMAVRLGLERARAAVAALEMIGLPAAVLGAGARVIAANPLLLALAGQVAVRARDRLAFVQPAAATLATSALERLGPTSSGTSIPLPATEAQAAAVAHLLPVRGAARDVFSSAQALLVVTPLAGAGVPDVELLGGLFDLTAAEARVARGLAEGSTLEDVAIELGVSRETVRTQLRSVFAKTGTGRQAELVRLLSRAVIRKPA